MAGGSDEWLRAFLIQQFLVAFNSDQGPAQGPAQGRRVVSYAEVESFWAMGLIKQVEALDGRSLLFAEGWDLDSARAVLRVHKALGAGVVSERWKRQFSTS